MWPQGGSKAALLHILPFIFLLGKILNDGCFFYNLISFIEFQLLVFITQFFCSMIDAFLSSEKRFYVFFFSV